jgi:hypothetical protein
MPNLIHAISEHYKEWQSWCRKPRYRAAVIIFKEKKPKCERCGRPTTTALHTADDYRHGFDHYVSVVEDLTAEAGCNACNISERKGMKPCPGCVKAYWVSNGQTKIRYIPQFMDLCSDCTDPGERALRKQEQEQFQAFVKKVRAEKNEQDRIARRPYQDEQNLRRRIYYREHKVVKKH